LVPRAKLIAVASAAGLALSVAGQATGSAALGHAGRQAGSRPKDPAKIRVLARPGKDFHKSLRVARRNAQAAAARDSGADQATFPTPESVGVSSATLDSIAACESGGDPTAVSADGAYHGKYQFDFGTWASVGGSGDPAAAPEAEQDYRAALLYAQSGSSPWPICG
jgi:soluble lytic murein transglycosylase-like protein